MLTWGSHMRLSRQAAGGQGTSQQSVSPVRLESFESIYLTKESCSIPAITIKVERPFVEELFARYETLIGRDFPDYRNHVHRTITYAMHFPGNT